MNWKQAFSTAIGRKLLMGATGLFLIVFLVIHCYVNAQIFWNDGGIKFNEAAEFMGNNPVIRIAEIGLFVFLLWHIILGLQLWFANMGRRKIIYPDQYCFTFVGRKRELFEIRIIKTIGAIAEDDLVCRNGLTVPV